MVPATAPIATFRIVVVASDPPLRRLLRETLENQFGHQIVGEATNGTEMVRTVLVHDPDVVVFDLHLPGCDGLDALRQIHEDHGIAAVAITAEDDHDLIRKVLEEYDLTYLVKPVQAHQLEPAVLAARARFDRFRQLQSENNSLRQSLQDRKIIERAKGVLMKRHRMSEAEAYRYLQRCAMNRRTRMIDLAHNVLNASDSELHRSTGHRPMHYLER